MTASQTILHAKISIKGSDFSFGMGDRYRREVRQDRKSGYSLAGLKTLNRVLLKSKG